MSLTLRNYRINNIDMPKPHLDLNQSESGLDQGLCSSGKMKIIKIIILENLTDAQFIKIV